VPEGRTQDDPVTSIYAGALTLPSWVHVNMPSGRTVLALLPLLALVVGLIVYCLVDLARARSVRYLPKAAWALVIVLGSAPFGAIAYLVLGRNRNDDRADGAPFHESPTHGDRAGV
jgi:hypothetical protein